MTVGGAVGAVGVVRIVAVDKHDKEIPLPGYAVLQVSASSSRIAYVYPTLELARLQVESMDQRQPEYAVVEARDFDSENTLRYLGHKRTWTDEAYHGEGSDLLIVMKK